MSKTSKPDVRAFPHKIRPVPVSSMRVPAVGISQRRFNKAQAEEYAANFDLNKFGVIVVNRRGEIYYIVDGQHRIAALKIFFAPSDPGSVDCVVYENLTDAEMADLFDGLSTRRATNRYDAFLIRCTAGRVRETTIRRTVEAQGLKVSQYKQEDCVGAVGALGKIYDRFGQVILGQSLRTAKRAFGGQPTSFDGHVLEGLAMVYNRYDGRTDETAMSSRLEDLPHGVLGLIRRAESQRERTGNSKVQCLAAAIVEAYNRGQNARSRLRLPSWWKTADE